MGGPSRQMTPVGEEIRSRMIRQVNDLPSWVAEHAKGVLRTNYCHAVSEQGSEQETGGIVVLSRSYVEEGNKEKERGGSKQKPNLHQITSHFT